MFEGAEIRVNRLDIAEMLQSLLERKTPSGVFACVRPTDQTCKEISKFFEDAGIPDLIAPSEYHVTVMYAPEQDLADFDIKEDVGSQTAKFAAYDLFGEDKDCLVMKLDSKGLHEIHDTLAAMGMKYTYPEYSPHLTLSYKAGDVDISTLPEPEFEFHFQPDLEVNAIDKDYKKKVETV